MSELKINESEIDVNWDEIRAKAIKRATGIYPINTISKLYTN